MHACITSMGPSRTERIHYVVHFHGKLYVRIYLHHLGEVHEQKMLNTNSTSRYFGQLRTDARKSWFIAIRLCSLSQQVQFAMSRVTEVSGTLNYLLSSRLIVARKLNAQLNGLEVFSFFLQCSAETFVLKGSSVVWTYVELSMNGLPSHSHLFTKLLLAH